MFSIDSNVSLQNFTNSSESNCYSRYLASKEGLAVFANIYEIVTMSALVVVAIIIMLITTFGKIQGEYKWFILNYAVMSMCYPIFYDLFFFDLVDWLIPNWKKSNFWDFWMFSMLEAGSEG